MKSSEERNDIILQYIDGTLSNEDKKKFEHKLTTDPKLKERLRELQAMDLMLSQQGVDFPPANFTQNVMANLHHSPELNTPAINKTLLLLTGIIVLIGIGVASITSGFFDTTQTEININTIEPLNEYIQKPLPTIPFDGKQILNAVIFVNLIIALVVLDRTVLKPLFQKRTQSHF